MKNSKTFKLVFSLSSISLLLIIGAGCVSKGLLTRNYPAEFYEIPNIMPADVSEINPTFIVYGDPQAGWRLNEKFLKPKNWITWKMLLFPFYEVYWFGNGIVGSINGMRRHPDYGAESRLLMIDAILAEAVRSDIDFILCIGDIAAHDGRRPEHWASFLRETREQHPAMREIPYLPVIGNHERANDSTYGWPNYQAVFGYPRFYVQEFRDAALFVVDSDYILDQNSHIDDDTQDSLFNEWFVSDDVSKSAWLEEKLAKCEATFKIVAMHHPPISFGKHHKDWLNPSYGKNLADKRKKLLNLFQEQGVQLVFSGHEHFYQHNVLRFSYNDDRKDGKIHFVISSGGGAPLRRPSSVKTKLKFQQHFLNEGLDITQIKEKDVYHYTLVKVTPRMLTIQTFEVAEEKSGQIALLEEILIQKL